VLLTTLVIEGEARDCLAQHVIMASVSATTNFETDLHRPLEGAQSIRCYSRWNRVQPVPSRFYRGIP
jgi:hypothetical protein